MLLLKFFQFFFPLISFTLPCPHPLVCNLSSLSLEISIRLFLFTFLLSYFSHCSYVVTAVTVHWIIIIIIVFLHQLTLMVFHGSLSDSKSSQVSRTLLSILAVLNNAVVRMVSTRPPTSKSSSPFSNHLVTVPNAPITIGIIVTCMSHSFFNSLARSRYLSFFSHSSSFILWSARIAKSIILQFLFICVVFRPRLGEPCVCQSPIRIYVCYFQGQVLGCVYTICLYDQTWISCTFPRGPLPTRSCLVLYSFCANLLHSLIMWLMVSSLSPHRLHYYFLLLILLLH